MKTEIVIRPTGDVQSIYDETFDFACLGAVSIRRVSFVEPDGQGLWWADLSPAGGPTLGPFNNRSMALGAEVDWLRVHAL